MWEMYVKHTEIAEVEMVNLGLQQNESIVIQSAEVRHGDSNASFSDELYLSNLNVIYVNKGVFGKVKEILKYPLRQLKIVDGKVSAICGKSPKNDSWQLQLFFLTGQESFEFEHNAKTEISKWVSQISQILKCPPIAEPASNGKISDMLKNAFGAVKNAWGVSGTQYEKITIKCIGCMAPISGEKGQIVRCKYCDTDNSLF